MAELEQRLAALAEAIEWPETPVLRLQLEPRRRQWRGLLVGVALAAAALAVAFSLPQARGAILRFLHLGGVTVVRVQELPPAQQRPLAAGLGTAESPAQARQELGFAPLLPPGIRHVYVADGVVSALLAAPQPALLSEFEASGPEILKKLASGSTTVTPVSVGRDPGLWLAGGEHVVIFPSLPPRSAGDVLVWTHGGTTLRLEGAGLSQADALRLARRITP